VELEVLDDLPGYFGADDDDAAGGPEPIPFPPLTDVVGALVEALRQPPPLLVPPPMATTKPAPLTSSVRRILPLPFDDVAARFDRSCALRLDTARPGWRADISGRCGWLAFTAPPSAAGAERSLLGRLHVPFHWRAVAVEVLVAPWSTARTELRLGMANNRRFHVPWRFFDAAHDVADVLRGELLA
jgi:hypothetical protein